MIQTPIACAVALTGILIHKVYRRRNPKPVPKVPKVIEVKCPLESQHEFCVRWDKWQNAKGHSQTEEYEFFQFINSVFEWPDGCVGKPFFNLQIPYMRFTEQLEDK